MRNLQFSKVGVYTRDRSHSTGFFGDDGEDSTMLHEAWKGIGVNKPPYFTHSKSRPRNMGWQPQPVCHLESGGVLTLDFKGAISLDGKELPELRMNWVEEVYPGILKGQPGDGTSRFYQQALPQHRGLPLPVEEVLFDEKGTILDTPFSVQGTRMARQGSCCMIAGYDDTYSVWYPETGRFLRLVRPNRAPWYGYTGHVSAFVMNSDPLVVLWHRSDMKTGFLSFPGYWEDKKISLPGESIAYEGLSNDGYHIIGTPYDYSLYGDVEPGTRVVRPLLVRKRGQGDAIAEGVIVRNTRASVTVSLIRRDGEKIVARIPFDPDVPRGVCGISTGVLPSEALKKKAKQIFDGLLVGDLAGLVSKREISPPTCLSAYCVAASLLQEGEERYEGRDL